MPENPSFRYYMIAASSEEGDLVQEKLSEIFPDENICPMNAGSFVARSKSHGQNAEFIYQSLSKLLPVSCSFFVSTVAIRTLLGSNLPFTLEEWRDFECEIAKQHTFN